MRVEKIDRIGLFPEHAGIGKLCYHVRATVLVRDALAAAGATITPDPDGLSVYVILGDTMPAGIIAVEVPGPPYVSAALRMSDEPEYPIEYPTGWRQVDWTPCPTCGAPLVWYEAGYTAGYRVCSRPPHHHAQAR